MESCDNSDSFFTVPIDSRDALSKRAHRGVYFVSLFPDVHVSQLYLECPDHYQ